MISVLINNLIMLIPKFFAMPRKSRLIKRYLKLLFGIETSKKSFELFEFEQNIFFFSRGFARSLSIKFNYFLKKNLYFA